MKLSKPYYWTLAGAQTKTIEDYYSIIKTCSRFQTDKQKGKNYFHMLKHDTRNQNIIKVSVRKLTNYSVKANFI